MTPIDDAFHRVAEGLVTAAAQLPESEAAVLDRVLGAAARRVSDLQTEPSPFQDTVLTLEGNPPYDVTPGVARQIQALAGRRPALQGTGTVTATELLSATGSASRGVDRQAFRMLLSCAAGGLVEQADEPQDLFRSRAWQATLDAVQNCARPGILHTGALPFGGAKLVSLLQEESVRIEKLAVKAGPQRVGPPGAVARQLHRSSAVIDFVSSLTGNRMTPTEIGGYLYYDGASGEYLFPHLDRELFAVNFLVMLSNEGKDGSGRSSSFETYAATGSTRYELEVGDALVFLASQTMHGRSPLLATESACLLSCGYAVALES